MTPKDKNTDSKQQCEQLLSGIFDTHTHTKLRNKVQFSKMRENKYQCLFVQHILFQGKRPG